MPTFTYTARAVNGDLKQATIEAANRDDVIAQLRKQRLNVVKVDEGGKEKKKRMGKIKMRDIVIFTRQFSTMINSGRDQAPTLPGYERVWAAALTLIIIVMLLNLLARGIARASKLKEK